MEYLERRTYDWTLAWNDKLEEYLCGQPRAGLFIDRLLRSGFDSALEIACGSARDSLFLREIGKSIVASDSSETVISKLGHRFGGLKNISFRVEDAKSLSFPSRSFDVSFHNGFYVLFDDDSAIANMLREQHRVTKRHVIFLVHNAHNPRLTRLFERKSRSDALYDIRFFTEEDIETIVLESGVTFRRMRILRFGGPADRFLHARIRGLPNPFRIPARRYLDRLYALTPLRAAERLVCHLEI